MSPFSTLLSIDHCVRFGSKPVLTDHTQFLVLLSQANSTAAFGFCVASTMIGTTLSFVAIDRAVGLDHRGDGVAQQRAVLGDPVGRGAIGVEHVERHQLDELHQRVQAVDFCLLREEHVLGMQRDAVDLAGDQAGQAARGGRGDELRVADVELADFSTSRPIRQLKPPTPPPVADSRLPLRSAAVLISPGTM